MRSDILNKLRVEIERRAEAQKAQAECEANMLCLCVDILFGSHQAGDHQAGAVETSRETVPAPSDKSVLTLSELAALLGKTTKTITRWVEDFGMPELRADADKSEPLYYWPEVHAWLRRHQQTDYIERSGNGRMRPAPSNGTRPQAKLR